MNTETPCAHINAARPEELSQGHDNKHTTGEQTSERMRPLNLRPINRYELHELVKANRKFLNITERELAVLHTHLTVLPRGDLSLSNLNVSFMSAKEVSRRTNYMDERKIRRAEVKLEEAKLIVRRLSGNGRRFPVRVKGRVVDAYGIDLAPLIARIDELKEQFEKTEELRALENAVRTRISAQLATLKRALCKAGVGVGSHLTMLAKDIRNKMRRTTTTLLELTALERDVTAVTNQLAPQDIQADNDVKTNETSGDNRQSVRHIESHQKESKKKEERQHIDHVFDEAQVGKVWDRTKTMKEFWPNPPKTHEQITRLFYYEVIQNMGITQETISKGLRVMGWVHFIKALDYFAGKVHELVKPNVYFQTMITKYMRGETVANSQIWRNPKDALCDYGSLL